MGERHIHHELEKQVYWRPDKLAMAFEGQEYTYREFDNRVNRTASALLSRGLGPGKRVLVHGFDHVDWHTLFFACSKTGATYCPVSTFQSRKNLSYITETLDPAVVAHTDETDIVDERLPYIEENAPGADYVCLDGGTSETTFEELLDGFGSDRPTGADDHDPDTVHNVFWTSGTTGRPKGVLRDHRASLHFADNLVNDLPFRPWNIRATTNPMMLIDAYFHYGIPTVMVGGTNVMIRTFSPETLTEAIRTYGVNSLHLGFTLARKVVEYLDERGETLELRYLSAVLPSANAARSLWPHTERLYHLYGTTEIGLPLVHELTPPFDERPPLGKPGIGSDVRIVPDGTVDIPTDPPSANETGELACRGETTMTRYLDPAVQEETVQNGWIRPGDVFSVTEDADLVFMGRTDDRLRTGGVNVFPGEVENVVEDHPAVENALVVGRPDETWGQRVCALVVSAEADTDDLVAELDEHCRESESLADETRPREYAFVESNDDIPTGALGKPDREAIVEAYFE